MHKKLGTILFLGALSIFTVVQTQWIAKMWENNRDRLWCRYALPFRADDWSWEQRLKYMYKYHPLFCNALYNIQSPNFLGVERNYIVRMIGTIACLLLPPVYNHDYGGYNGTNRLQAAFRCYACHVFAPGIREEDRKLQLDHAHRILDEQEEWFFDVRDHLNQYRWRWAKVLGVGIVMTGVAMIYHGLEKTLQKRWQLLGKDDPTGLKYVRNVLNGVIVVGISAAFVAACNGMGYWVWRTKKRCTKGLEQIAVLKKELAAFAHEQPADMCKEVCQKTETDAAAGNVTNDLETTV